MKTTFDVLDKIFPIINVTAVKATLDGKVYRNSRPVGSTTRDIVVVALPIAGGADIDLQGCVAIVNCFAKDLADGRLDDKNLDAMTTAVVTAIELYAATNNYFNPEINSQGVMEDMDATGISYSSIRINCTIQFET